MCSDLQDRLELHLTEVELLQSMFPADGEFCFDDPSVVSDVRSVVDDIAQRSAAKDSEVPLIAIEAKLRQISFCIKILVANQETAASDETEVQLQCSLPMDYPQCLPDVNVQSNALSRQQYKRLNDDLKEHLQSLERGELCVTEAVLWLQENATDYLQASLTSSTNYTEKEKESRGKKPPSCFTRLWIHSHHIYSRSKREDIFAWSKEWGLTGFSLPGKPGIICVEGPQGDVDEFWHKLRRLNWKKLTSKHREDFPLVESDKDTLAANFRDQRHFADFQEINFDVRGSRDYHMDLGQFFQYLEKHGCADVFKILLGVDGRVSQKETS